MHHNDTGLINNESASRFEWFTEGGLAFITYEKSGSALRLVHTEVPKALEGKGIAGALVEKVLRYSENENMRIVPLCSYVQHYLQRNPAWEHLVEKP